MSKDLCTKALQSCIAANTQGDIQSLGQEISSAKVKLDMPVQNFD